METNDPKAVLWENITHLMGGVATVDAVHRKAKTVGRGTIQRIKEGNTSVGTNVLAELASAFGVEPWQLILPPQPQDPLALTATASADLTIRAFNTELSGDIRVRLDDQPGVIKAWRVTPEWLRLKVPNHSGVENLCIVTGFGPSMRPMFNPGDPVLVDTGVRTVTHDGVYFFRVGEEGFVKLIQRVPAFDGPGFTLRVLSKNPDYPPYDISPTNPHFEVIGKVLTVWRSDDT
jgi:SOS-response transcriptional repressor LexA